MTKTRRYLLEQGQQGIRPSGGGMDIDTELVVSQPTTVLIASMPFEVEFWRCPLFFAADAVVSTLMDVNPSVEPAYNYQVQEVSLTLNAAFVAAANSFKVLVRLWRAGVLVGTVATFDASVTSFTAHLPVALTSGLANTKFQPGDILTYQIVQNAAGANCPPFLLTIDGQA